MEQLGIPGLEIFSSKAVSGRRGDDRNGRKDDEIFTKIYLVMRKGIPFPIPTFFFLNPCLKYLSHSFPVTQCSSSLSLSLTVTRSFILLLLFLVPLSKSQNQESPTFYTLSLLPFNPPLFVPSYPSSSPPSGT